MRIAQVTPYYFPSKGWIGPITVVHEISRQLASRNHEVSIITTVPSNSLACYESLPNVSVFRYKLLKGVKTYFIAPLALLHIIKQKKYDIIHIHGYRNFFADIGTFFSFSTRRPLIMTPHGALEQNVAQRRGFLFEQMKFDRYDRFVRDYVPRAAKRIFFSSKQEKRLSKFKHKGVIVPFGVDIERFQKPKSESFRKKLFIAEDEVVILSVARISLEKNTLMLLKALNIIKQKGFNNIKLVIVGESLSAVGRSNKKDYYAQITDYIKKYNLYNDIRIIKGLFGSDLVTAYSSADIFVLISLAENFCLPILEAAAVKLPIISTKVGVAPDFIADKKNGILLKNIEITELVEAIIFLIENPIQAKKMGKKAFEKAKKRYSWKIIGNKINQHYFQISDI